MRRGTGKKTIEKRKRTRGRTHSAKDVALSEREIPKTRAIKHFEICKNCSRNLSGSDQALFVEEEIGRVFCSENCIAGFFSDDIERLEKEYFRKLSPSDLTGQARDSLNHL